MAWKLQNFQPLDLTSKLTLSIDGWDSLTIHNNIAYIAHRYPSKWMKADVDSNGNFNNFSTLNLSNEFIFHDEWEKVVFKDNKAYFINWRHAYWYMASVDSNGNFYNFLHTDMNGILTSTPTKGWTDLVFHNNKVIFLHAESHKTMIADIPNNWDKDLRHLTNFKVLNFRGLVQDDIETIGLTIRDGKAIFANVDSNEFSIADVTNDAHFSNFKRYDLSSELTTSPENWDGVTFHGNKAIFANTIRSKWMIADIINDTPSGGGTGGGTTGGGTPSGTVTPTPVPTVDPNAWHYGNGAGGPHATKNDWKGAFSSHAKQVEFEAIKDSVSDHGFDNEVNITAISLPNVTSVGEYAFFRSNFTTINLPKVYSIGNNAFFNTVNAQITEVTLPDLFDNDADKNRIFGENQWQRITFHWLHDTLPANSIWWNGKFQDTQFEMDGKTVVKFIWNGKECVLKSLGFDFDPNAGTWRSLDMSNIIIENTWFDMLVINGKALILNNSAASFVIADVDGDGNFSNIQNIDLSSKLTSKSSGWTGINIYKNRIYFINKQSNTSMVADIDDSLNMTNFRLLNFPIDYSTRITFYNNKAYLANSLSSQWYIADIANDGDLTNIKNLSFSSKLTSSSSQWASVVFKNGKAYFVNENSAKWMTADVDDSGNFSNFSRLDLSSKPFLDYDNENIVFLDNSVILVNRSASKWYKWIPS